MSSAPVSFGGVESGLDTSAIIAAEMAVFEMPLTSLQGQQTTLNTQISDYQSLNSELLTLQQSADALSSPTAYEQAFAVSSSNAGIASGSISSGATTGSLTLAVDQLATNSTQISSGTVASTNDVVASGDVLVGSGGQSLGLGAFSAGSGLALGTHTISVTQASAGASVTAGSALGASTTITAANDELDVNVDGAPVAVVVPDGTYTPAQLAAALTQASNGTLNASVNSGGVLTVATSQEGSSASLQVTGGSVLSSLGLSSGSGVSGTDGVVDVDGTSTTLSDLAGTGSTAVTVASGDGGTVTLEVNGALDVGSMTAANVSVGNGSLASVVAAINGANLGVSATALEVGANQYALEVTATTTGVAGAATIDTNAFSTSSLGALNTTTAAQNAVVSIGGVGGYQVTSASNTVTGLLPGVSVQLSEVSSAPVTLTVSPDGSQVVGAVGALVDAANAVLSSIASDTSYNQATNTAAALNGQTSLTTLAQEVLAIVGNAVGASAAGSDGTAGESAGLAITSSGAITFNQSAFESAYDQNPSAVQSMFIEGGSFAPSSPAYAGDLGVDGATNATLPGTYAVSISQSAAQALDTGSATFGATSSSASANESYTVTSGATSATYAVTAGESVADVVSGMDSAFAAAGLDVSASLVGAPGAYSLALTSGEYGAAQTFSVAAGGADELGLTSAGATFSGLDVEGTINGSAATGLGQFLSLNDATNQANGLVLQVNATGITSATSLGTVTYSPGLAQSLANLAEQATITPGGEIPNTLTGLNANLQNVSGQIALQQQLVATQKATLTQEFTKMEETLATLNSESKFLAESATSSAATSSNSTSGLDNSSSSSSGL